MSYEYAPAPAPSAPYAESQEVEIQSVVDETPKRKPVIDIAWNENTSYIQDDIVLYAIPNFNKAPLALTRFKCIKDHVSSQSISPESTEYWIKIDSPIIALIGSAVFQVVLPFLLVMVLVYLFLPLRQKVRMIYLVSVFMIILSILMILINMLIRKTYGMFIYTAPINAIIHVVVMLLFIITAFMSNKNLKVARMEFRF